MLKKGPLWALGTMSGTSLDGVDAALVETDGAAIFGFGESAYRNYTLAQQEALRAALGRWPGEPGVAEAARVVEDVTAELLAPLAGKAELIGFHGQTLAHEPGGRGTHQAGDGALLARALERPVVWDFRSADVRLGGQGAPLVPFFHHACARWAGLGAPVLFLNLGGVGNVTFVDPSRPVEDGCLAFDTGPANAPINDLMRARRGLERDEGGALAAQGKVRDYFVRRFLKAPFFSRIPPKSLDRNEFSGALDVTRLRDADACATLTACAARAVAAGLLHLPEPPLRCLVTGGGRHNATLMRMLAEALPCAVEPVEAVGLDGDMLEAQAFAYLAVRVARGLPTSGPRTTGVAALVGGGQVSQP